MDTEGKIDIEKIVQQHFKFSNQFKIKYMGC